MFLNHIVPYKVKYNNMAPNVGAGAKSNNIPMLDTVLVSGFRNGTGLLKLYLNHTVPYKAK